MPFGVGTGIELTAGDVVKSAVGNLTYMGAFIKNIGALTSALSPDLSVLGGEETIKIMGGSGLNQVITGESKNQQTYIGRNDQTGILDTVNQSSKQTSSEVLQVDIDKEQEAMKKQQEALGEINDNVAFIVKLLNIEGIKIRSDYSGGNQDYVATPDIDKDSVYIMGGY
jgi:hypothetical protein